MGDILINMDNNQGPPLTLIMLSSPPVSNKSPLRLNETAVTW